TDRSNLRRGVIRCSARTSCLPVLWHRPANALEPPYSGADYSAPSYQGLCHPFDYPEVPVASHKRACFPQTSLSCPLALLKRPVHFFSKNLFYLDNRSLLDGR